MMTGSEKNTRQSKKQKQGKAFVLPAYEKGKKIIQGSLVIAVPDGFEDYDKDGAVLIKNEDDLLCISVSELSSGDIDISWPDQADADKAAMLSKIGNCKNVRIFMENDNITLAYGKNGEAGKDEEPYWKSYSLIFLTEASAWLFELRFNYRRSTAKNYNTAVEDFGSRLALVPSKHITREVQIEETKTAAAEPGPQVVGNVLQSAKADEGVLTAEEAVIAVDEGTAQEKENISASDEIKARLVAKEREFKEADAQWKEYVEKREELALKLEEAEKASIKLLTDKMIEEESYKLQINSKRNELKKSEEQLVQLDTERKEIKIKKENYKSNIKELRAECRKKSDELAKKRVELVKSLFELNSEISGIREEKDDKKNQLKSAFLFKKKKRQEYDEVKKRLNEKDSEISACDQDIKELDDKIEEIKDNTENEINRIKDEISLMSERERGLQLELNSARDQIKELKEGLTSLEEQIKNYDLRHANDGKELDGYKKQYETYEGLVNQKAARREELLKEITELKGQLV